MMDDGLTSWRELFISRMAFNGETLADVISNTMSEQEMDVRFYSSFGGVEGIPFTVWTTNNVYFPACCDGSEWVGSVSRNPDGKATDHIGND